MNEFRVKYDRLADVLYVSTERNGPSYAREGSDGIVWRYLESDGSLVGVTILDFDCYWKGHLPDLADQVARHFHVPTKKAKTVLEHANA
jgi:uncharacterized protein YuzE